MATTSEFIYYVVEQVESPEWNVAFRKMFGEYMVYFDGKPALLVCDNTVFVKKLPEIMGYFDENAVGVPYDGAKEHFVLDIDDAELSKDVLRALLPYLTIPRKK